MEKDTSRTIVKQAVRFFSGTIISRITGLLRDITMAACFGTTPSVAAFMIAFRLTNLLRRVLGEGAMQSALIPYLESLKKKNIAQAYKFFRDLILIITLFLMGVILCIEIGCALWLSFSPPTSNWKDVIVLTMLSLPALLFICLYGLFSSFLQCEKRFFLPGIAPVFFNIVWIGAAFMLKDLPSMEAMKGLSISLIVAYGMQWLCISGPVFARLSEHIVSWRMKLEIEPVKRLFKPLVFTILGVSAGQVNSSLDPLFARIADLDGPVYLWYAIRIQQLPLALFGIAIASALLPTLSRLADQDDNTYYKKVISGAIHKTVLFMIPLTFLMISLGTSILNILFGHGDFKDEALVQSTWCLWGYMLGLLPMTIVLLYATVFYAQKNFRAPLKASLLSMGVNAGLNTFFVFALSWGAASIAFATSIAAFINQFILGALLKKKGLSPYFRDFIKQLTSIVIASVAAATTTIYIGFKWLGDPTLLIVGNKKAVYNHGFFNQLRTLSLEAFIFLTIGFIAWVVSSYALRSRKS